MSLPVLIVPSIKVGGSMLKSFMLIFSDPLTVTVLSAPGLQTATTCASRVAPAMVSLPLQVTVLAPPAPGVTVTDVNV
jgi:hypothetical protein